LNIGSRLVVLFNSRTRFHLNNHMRSIFIAGLSKMDLLSSPVVLRPNTVR
jgi:hypothetical protein